jgi:hypothetical protein
MTRFILLENCYYLREEISMFHKFKTTTYATLLLIGVFVLPYAGNVADVNAENYGCKGSKKEVRQCLKAVISERDATIEADGARLLRQGVEYATEREELNTLREKIDILEQNSQPVEEDPNAKENPTVAQEPSSVSQPAVRPDVCDFISSGQLLWGKTATGKKAELGYAAVLRECPPRRLDGGQCIDLGLCE